MSYDYDWCGHVADEPDARACGAPIERWSREWRHRKSELDTDHKAAPQEPVGPLEEGLHLRADRYATAIAASVAADERIAALTELLRQHEYYRSQAENTLALVQEDPQFGTVWSPTGPEPEDVSALLCLTTGTVYLRRPMVGGPDGWRRAERNRSTATHYQWPIDSAGPFIAWRDDYGFDQVLRETNKLETEFDALHRRMHGEKGYRAEDAGFGRPPLAEALERILMARTTKWAEENDRALAAERKLAQLRRSLESLVPDDTQQWPTEDGDGELRDVAVIDLQRVHDLLDKPEHGGAS